MILELRIKNFLSFKEEAVFSFEATSDKTFEDYQVVQVAPNVRILRLAIVYGANASGKSNLIQAFDFLRRFWLRQPNNKDSSTKVEPFLLSQTTPNEPSELTLIFYVSETKYMYSLELNASTVLSEKLFIYPGIQPALIFERKLNDSGISEIVFNPKRVKISQAAKDVIAIKCLTNMSLFAAYNQVNVAVPEIDRVIEWAKTQYSFPIITPNESGLVIFTERSIMDSQPTKDYILNFLREADYNITNISAEVVEAVATDELLSAISNDEIQILESENDRLQRGKSVRFINTEFEHKIVNDEGHEELYKLRKERQSEGTLRTFGLAGAIRETTELNAFLAIDEVESSLHPRLIEFIIEDFFKQKGQSQLLLTTHYDGLLGEDDLLRKDSIWFANKKENGSTELYSLADFKGVNRISCLQKAYRHGKFGAVPNI